MKRTLESSRIKLAAVTSDSYPWLYRLATSDEVSWRWRWRGMHPSPEAFAQRLWQDILIQHVVVAKSNSRPIGLVQAYRPDLVAGHCQISAMFDPSYQRRGWPLEAVELFIDYLFAGWALNKVYAETYDDSAEAFDSGLGDVFEEEGRLKAHAVMHGEPVDLRIIATYREVWQTHRSQGSVRTRLADLL